MRVNGADSANVLGALQRRLVVVGASTGGLAALSEFAGALPVDLRAAVLIVQHIGNRASRLVDILQKRSALPVRFAVDMDPLVQGTVLIAPPDHHLLAYPSHVRLVRSAKENYARPAIDPLFRTAAAAYRQNAIGIVLSGDLDDGTVGLQAIQAYGGLVMVQDPAEAIAPSMPASASRYTEVDYSLSAAELGAMVGVLVAQRTNPSMNAGMDHIFEVDNRFAEMRGDMEDLDRVGTISNFTCPECHGTLWEINKPSPLRYRCHTGHSYTARHLGESQDIAIEEALWGAIRALQEKQKLFEKFKASAVAQHDREGAGEYAAQAEVAEQQAAELKMLVVHNRVPESGMAAHPLSK